MRFLIIAILFSCSLFSQIDNTNYVQKMFDIKECIKGDYYITNTLTITNDVQLVCPNVKIWTDRNIDIIHIASKYSLIQYLTIDVSKVKNPKGKKIITYKHRNNHIQYGGLDNVRLIGNQFETRKEGAGFVGVYFDSSDGQYNGDHKNHGESHFMDFNIETRYMKIGFYATNKQSYYNSNGAHDLLRIKDIGSKQAIVLDSAGSFAEIYSRTQARYSLTEKEKNLPSVYLGTKHLYFKGRVSDLRKSPNSEGKIPWGQSEKLYLPFYSLENNGVFNVIDKDFAIWNFHNGNIIETIKLKRK